MIAEDKFGLGDWELVESGEQAMLAQVTRNADTPTVFLAWAPHPMNEAIEITYDPAQTDYRTLLEFFFQIHDPTTLNRQGNDRGLSYRSGIYYVDEEQKRIAEDTIADVDASGLWDGKVVTEVSPAPDFWEAEPEHQDYLERYPNGYTCHFPRAGWKLPRRSEVS